MDGVFVRDAPDATSRFVQAPPPCPELLADVVARLHKRVHRWLKRHGYAYQTPVEERSNELPEDDR